MSLSAMVQFEVGGFVHRQSWGKRSSAHHRHDKKHSSNESLWTGHNFLLLDKIGQGHFGVVYRALHRPTDHDSFYEEEQVALKRFSKRAIYREMKDFGPSLTMLRREISIHSSIQHPHIIPFLGFYEEPNYLCLVLKMAPHGDLLDFMGAMPANAERHRLDLARLAVAQVASALSYLQTLQIAHRDLKPENLLVTGPSHVELADFGWACWWNPTQTNRTLCGTPEYVPPQMLSLPRIYQAAYVDSWALGVLAWELVHKATPFYEAQTLKDEEEHREVIFDKIRDFSPHQLRSSDPLLQDFCVALMHWQPEDRLTAEQALQHPFLSGTALAVSPSKSSPTVAQRCQLFSQTATVNKVH